MAAQVLATIAEADLAQALRDLGDEPAAARLAAAIVAARQRAPLERTTDLVRVILEATHTCMTIRGVRKPDGICTTSAMRGVFRENQATRNELMALIYGRR